jgi:preprotein translocase subunit SecE
VAWFQRLKAFLVEVWAELQKTTWPARREVYGTTVVVIVAVLITALYLYVVDMALERGMQTLFKGLGH